MEEADETERLMLEALFDIRSMLSAVYALIFDPEDDDEGTQEEDA